MPFYFYPKKIEKILHKLQISVKVKLIAAKLQQVITNVNFRLLKMDGLKNNKLFGGYIKYILLNEFLV